MAAVRQVGGMDEGFMRGLWYDDDAFTYELWQTGLPFVFDDSVSGVHQHHERPVLATPDGQAAIARVRSGAGPVILEMRTYRYRGHSMSDPAKYRTREEVQEVRAHRDPIELVGKRLTEAGHADEERLKQIDKDIRAIVNEAADFATSDPEPEASELHTDVLART